MKLRWRKIKFNVLGLVLQYFSYFTEENISSELSDNPVVDTGFINPVASKDLCNDDDSLCQTKTTCHIFIVFIYAKKKKI